MIITEKSYARRKKRSKYELGAILNPDKPEKCLKLRCRFQAKSFSADFYVIPDLISLPRT